MSETMNKTKLKIMDIEGYKKLFAQHGYAIVNDFELPEDGLGFDITGNEVMQFEGEEQNYSYEDMSEIEKYLNGSGYSIVAIEPTMESHPQQMDSKSDLTFCNKYIGEMALIRTLSSFFALILSVVITYKVW